LQKYEYYRNWKKQLQKQVGDEREVAFSGADERLIARL